MIKHVEKVIITFAILINIANVIIVPFKDNSAIFFLILYILEMIFFEILFKKHIIENTLFKKMMRSFLIVVLLYNARFLYNTPFIFSNKPEFILSLLISLVYAIYVTFIEKKGN